MKISNTLLKIVTSLSAIIISLFIAELFLQGNSPLPNYYVWKPDFSITLKVAPKTMPGINDDSNFSINKQGLRGDIKNDNAKLKILTIGGSTTECFYLDNKEAWPYLTQENLNASSPNYSWVGNIGRSGLNSNHHVIELEKGIKQYGDIDMIIFMVGINDLIRDINYAQGITIDHRSMLDQTFMVSPKLDTLKYYEKSKVYQLVSNVFKAKTKQKQHIQDKGGIIYNKWRSNRQNNIGIIDTIPELTKELINYKANIKQLIDYCKVNNIEPLFLLQPTMYDINLPAELEQLLWLGGIGDFQSDTKCPYYSTQTMLNLIDEYNTTTKNICKTNQVSFIDLPSMFPKDTNVFYDDCHFNESGSRLVAKTVSDYILSKPGH